MKKYERFMDIAFGKKRKFVKEFAELVLNNPENVIKLVWGWRLLKDSHKFEYCTLTGRLELSNRGYFKLNLNEKRALNKVFKLWESKLSLTMEVPPELIEKKYEPKRISSYSNPTTRETTVIQKSGPDALDIGIGVASGIVVGEFINNIFD